MKIVVLTSRFPYPIEKGDKLRLFHQLRSLAERHEVVLVAITEQPPSAQELAVMQGFCASIHLLPLPKWRIFGNLVRSFFTKMPLQVGYFYSPKLQQAFNRIVASEQPDYLYCQMIRTAPYLQHAPLPRGLVAKSVRPDPEDQRQAEQRRGQPDHTVAITQPGPHGCGS